MNKWNPEPSPDSGLGRQNSGSRLRLESVRRLQAGLQSFLSMRRIEARRKKASAFSVEILPILGEPRQRLSHALVRSTDRPYNVCKAREHIEGTRFR